MPRPKSKVKMTRLNLALPIKCRKKLERLVKETEAASMTEVVRKAIDCYERNYAAEAGMNFPGGTDA